MFQRPRGLRYYYLTTIWTRRECQEMFRFVVPDKDQFINAINLQRRQKLRHSLRIYS